MFQKLSFGNGTINDKVYSNLKYNQNKSNPINNIVHDNKKKEKEHSKNNQVSSHLNVLKNNGHDFTAPLKVKRSKKKIEIIQTEEAKSKTSNITFNIYKYDCFEDRKGNFSCKATSSSNTVTFYLTKI